MAQKKTTAKKHSRFPPSTMERVLTCKGSFALEATLPSKESFYTDEGHAAHRLAEWALTDGTFDTRAYIGRDITFHQNQGTPQETLFTFKVDENMCAAVQDYVDAVHHSLVTYQKDKKVKSVTLDVEKKVDTSVVMSVKRQSGTIDTLLTVIYKDGTGFISVEDLKYGANVKVDAKDNIQLMTYAAAVAANNPALDIKKAELVIHMPRLKHCSRDIVSITDLNAHAATLQQGVKDALAQEKLFKEKGAAALTLAPGEKQCRFCKAKKICPAFNAAANAKKSAKPAAPKPPGKTI